MRTSLSCEYCRRSKIKCTNAGKAPCRKCERLGNQDCRLSRPQTKAGRRIPRPSRRTKSVSRSSTAGEPSENPAPEEGEDVLAELTEGGSIPEGPCLITPTTTHIDEHLTTLSLGTILQALSLFTNKVPELRILHPAVFVMQYQDTRSRESKALLATVLAIVETLSPTSDASGLGGLLPASIYKQYAQEVLLAHILLPPKVEVVQGLLILAFYEWGIRDFHQAWMHCGIAIRIMQSLHSSRVAPYPLDISQQANVDELSAAAEARTYWACFIMDCTINSGLYTPRMLPMAEMRKLRVSHPLSTIEFAFGSKLRADPIHPPPADWRQPSSHVPPTLDPSQSFEIMVGGFDIYSQVMAFVFNDGRRAPGMCALENCPWTPGSLWDTCRSQLEGWRMTQHHMLHYPENSVALHVALGYGESFIYINLIYYMCRLMLHREYSPFLPTLETTPRGPIDPPLLEAEAPPGWWDNGARELYESGEHIASLLYDASQLDLSLCTPFTGFCAFTACFLNMYITYFPNMNLGRSRDSKVRQEWGQRYLKEFQNIWALGDGWVKTLRNAAVLYEAATSDRQRYRNKSRFDFDTLHQSVHEFRVVDRSEQHMLQIHRAETQPASPADAPLEGCLATSALPEITLASFNWTGMDGVGDGQPPGLWPNWWSTLEDVDLPDGLAN